MRHALILTLCLLVMTLPLRAALVVTLQEICVVADKAVLKLGIKNQYPEAVIASRATFFLMRADGKVVGRHSVWLIGDGQRLQSLPAGAATNWNVVMPMQGEFERANVVFGPVVLGSGARGNGRWETGP